jgi:hypothetical protein
MEWMRNKLDRNHRSSNVRVGGSRSAEMHHKYPANHVLRSYQPEHCRTRFMSRVTSPGECDLRPERVSVSAKIRLLTQHHDDTRRTHRQHRHQLPHDPLLHVQRARSYTGSRRSSTLSRASDPTLRRLSRMATVWASNFQPSGTHCDAKITKRNSHALDPSRDLPRLPWAISLTSSSTVTSDCLKPIRAWALPF